MDRTAALASLAREYDEFWALADSLSADEWAAQSLCTEWSMKDVAAHIVSMDRDAITGRFFLGLLPGRTIDGATAKGVDEFRAMAPDEVVQAGRVWGRRLHRLMWAGSVPLWNLRLPTPLGRLRGQALVGIRIFDLFCHNRDIAVPLGRPEPDLRRAAPVLETMIAAMGTMSGPKLAAFNGRTVGIEVGGPISGRWTWTIGDLDAASVDALPDGLDATMSTDTHTFVVAGSGRVAPVDAAADGRIKTSGDEALTAAFLEHWYIQ